MPPLLLFRSFLTVTSGLVVFMLGFFAIGVSLGYAMFPEFVAFIDLDAEAQEALMADDPSRAVPQTMFLLWVGLTMLLSLAIGFYVFATAPFSRPAHVACFAILLAVMFLQMSFSDPPAKKYMSMVYLVSFPICIWIGGWLAEKKFSPPQEITEE